MTLLLASNNAGKIAEIKALLPGWHILSMREAGFNQEIPEPFETFRQNAFQKANTLYQWSGKACLADDSGICIHALNNAPGVHSARYAGLPSNDQANNQKLLQTLQGISDRRAYYVAVLCLIVQGTAHYFEAQCPGSIADTPQGNGGFGYDPLFIPDGYDQSFGLLDPRIKKKLSHRAKALQLMLDSGLLAAPSL